MRKKQLKNVYPLPEPDRYALVDAEGGGLFSKHPNVEGAQLSSLFHVKTGQTVRWKNDPRAPTQVAHSWGYVGKTRRFRVHAL